MLFDGMRDVCRWCDNDDGDKHILNWNNVLTVSYTPDRNSTPCNWVMRNTFFSTCTTTELVKIKREQENTWTYHIHWHTFSISILKLLAVLGLLCIPVAGARVNISNMHTFIVYLKCSTTAWAKFFIAFLSLSLSLFVFFYSHSHITPCYRVNAMHTNV